MTKILLPTSVHHFTCLPEQCTCTLKVSDDVCQAQPGLPIKSARFVPNRNCSTMNPKLTVIIVHLSRKSQFKLTVSTLISDFLLAGVGGRFGYGCIDCRRFGRSHVW